MEYNEISTSNILDKCQESIAKYASREASEDGTLLYDALVNYSSDDKELKRLISASCASLVSAFGNIMEEPVYPNDDGEISFYLLLPDHEEDFTLDTNELENLVVFDVTFNWFKRRKMDKLAESLSAERESCMMKLSKLLYKRSRVTR